MNDGQGRIHGSVPQRSAEAVAGGIPPDATLLVSGFGRVGYPKAVPLALADDDRSLSLTVVSGGNVGDEIDTAMVEAGAIARRYPYQGTSASRAAANENRMAYSDRNVSQVGDEVRYGGLVEGPTTAVVEAVAVGPDWLIPSTSIGQTPAFVAAADELVVEVNHAQPRALEAVHDVYTRDPPPGRDPIPLDDPWGRVGTPRVEFDPDILSAVVETDRSDSTYSFRDPTGDDQAIAGHVADFLRSLVESNPVFAERLTLQFGVGSLGNALMGELTGVDFGDRDIVYFGEVFQDGLLDMLDAGELAAASATTLALSDEGQSRFFNDIDRYAEDVVLRPTDVSNAAELVDRFGVVAVNSALEIDLFGHVNSTHANGRRVITGVGGSGDYNRNALVTVCALPSRLGDGTSRVVPMVPHVDHTEHDVDVVVTEQGVADIRGCSPVERAERIVDDCAHPAVQEDLRTYLDEAKAHGGHLPYDAVAAAQWQR